MIMAGPHKSDGGEIKIIPEDVKLAGDKFKDDAIGVRLMEHAAQDWEGQLEWGEGASHDALTNRFRQMGTGLEKIACSLEDYGEKLNSSAAILEGVDANLSSEYSKGAEDSFHGRDDDSQDEGQGRNKDEHDSSEEGGADEDSEGKRGSGSGSSGSGKDKHKRRKHK